MINKILAFFGFKTKIKIDDIQQLNIRVMMLEIRMAELTEKSYCDGTRCDPWPELTRAEEESGCEWTEEDMDKMRGQLSEDIDFSKDFQDFMKGWKESEEKIKVDFNDVHPKFQELSKKIAEKAIQDEELGDCNHVGCNYDYCTEDDIYFWGGSYENLLDKEEQCKFTSANDCAYFGCESCENKECQTQEEMIDEAFRKGQQGVKIGFTPNPKLVESLKKHIEDFKEDLKENEGKAQEVNKYLTGFDYVGRVDVDGGLIVKEGEMIMDIKTTGFTMAERNKEMEPELEKALNKSFKKALKKSKKNSKGPLKLDIEEAVKKVVKKPSKKKVVKKKANKHTGGSLDDFLDEEKKSFKKVAKKVAKKKS
jgi:hypothetical protein